MAEDKELIWVSKRIAEEYKQLDSVEEQERAVKKVIEKKRLDLNEEQELLSESLLQFKSVCLAHRKELEKTYQEQADKLYSLWEEMGDVSTMVAEHSRMIAAGIDPIRREVSELAKGLATFKRELAGLDLHVPTSFVEVASVVGRMDDKTKGLLRDLLTANIPRDECRAEREE
jgi:RecB family endonuclease NucS